MKRKTFFGQYSALTHKLPQLALLNFKPFAMLFFCLSFSLTIYAQGVCWDGECAVCLDLQSNGSYAKDVNYKVPVLYDASVPANSLFTEVTGTGNLMLRNANTTCNNGLFNTTDDFWITVGWRTTGKFSITQRYQGVFFTESRSLDDIIVASPNPALDPSAFSLDNLVSCPSPSTSFTFRRLHPENPMSFAMFTIEECTASGSAVPNGATFSMPFYSSQQNPYIVIDNRSNVINFQDGKYYKVSFRVNTPCGSNITSSQILHIQRVIADITSNVSLPKCSTTQYALLTANATGTPPFAYHWSNNATTASINAPNGTYTVTVTNSSGCTATSSKEVTSIAVTAMINNADGNYSNCFNNGSLYLQASMPQNSGNSTDPINYNWSGGNVSIANPAIINVTGTGAYTVTCTDVNGCTATRSIDINDGCCLPDYNTIGDDINSVTHIGGAGWLNKVAKIVVNGTLIVDDGDVLFLSGSDIKMCEGSSIIVKNGRTFTMTASAVNPTPETRISSISKIAKNWNGIIVETGAKIVLNAMLGTQMTPSSVNISGADIAILAMPESKVQILQSVIFADNKVAIKTPENNGTRYTVDMNLYGATFKISANSTPYRGPDEGYIGVLLNDVITPSISTGANGVLTFFNLDCGIVMHNSVSTFYNPYMYGIGFVPRPTKPLAGTAVIADKGSSIGVYGSYTLISNAKNGFYIKDADAIIENGLLAGITGNGIAIVDNNMRNCTIKNTRIMTDKYGILINRCNNSIFNIDQNSLVTEGTGIACFSTKSLDGNQVNITQNEIESRGSNGVQLSGCTDNTNIHTDYKVWNNRITLNDVNNAVEPTGIYIENSSGVGVCSNVIIGQSPSSQAATGADFPAAIRSLDSRRTLISCNNMDNSYTGVLFQGTADDTELQYNEINNHTQGLKYSGTVGIDFHEQHNKGNHFLVNGQTVAANNQAVDLITRNMPGQIFYNDTDTPPAGYTYDGQPKQTNDPTYDDWFAIDNNGHEKDCTDAATSLAICPLHKPSHAALDEAESIVLDLARTPEFGEDTHWSAKYLLYQYLKANPDSLQGHALLEDFIDSLQNKAIGQLADLEAAAKTQLSPSESLKIQVQAYQRQIDALTDSLKNSMLADSLHTGLYDTKIANLKSLLSATQTAYKQAVENYDSQIEAAANGLKISNQAIIPIELQEVNSKIVNQVYFEKELNKIDTLTAAEYATLVYIADQCPYTGGKAVHEARGILARLAYRTYNNHALCAAQGINLRQKPKETKQAINQVGTRYYPNPASDYILLETTDAGQLTLTDALGREALKQSISEGKQIISTVNLPNGLYHLSLKKGTDEVVNLGKLSVINH